VDLLIVIVAQYFFLLSIAITGLAWLRLPAAGKWPLAVTGITGGLLGLGLIVLAGSLYHDRRPFVVEHIRPLFAHAADNGFPSDHATLVAFLAVCVLFYSRRWGVSLVVIAVLVGAARVAAHVHSPLDIAAGYLIGAVAALAAHWAAPWIVRRLPMAPSLDRPGPGDPAGRSRLDRVERGS